MDNQQQQTTAVLHDSEKGQVLVSGYIPENPYIDVDSIRTRMGIIGDAYQVHHYDRRIQDLVLRYMTACGLLVDLFPEKSGHMPENAPSKLVYNYEEMCDFILNVEKNIDKLCNSKQ